MTSDSTPEKTFHPNLQSRLNAARARSKLYFLIRTYYESQGFLEVQTPTLVPYGTAEANIDPMRARLQDAKKMDCNAYLIPSPEVHHKKLLAEGFAKTFELARCFRNAESFASPIHNPEFTMLEWYRRGGTFEECIQDTIELIFFIHNRWNTCKLPASPAETITMAKAFLLYANIDLEAMTDFNQLPEIAHSRGYGNPGTLDDAFYLLFLNEVEPRLVEKSHPVILTHYPWFQAAFAKSSADARFAERFEMYWGGVELANGYGELCDPEVQRTRMLDGIADRKSRGLETQELDEDFLHAVGAIPGACGCALGVDRLLMVLEGAKTLSEVILFPVEKIFGRCL